MTTFPHYPEWRFADGGGVRTTRSSEHGVDVTRLRHLLPRRASSVSRVVSELSFGLRVALRRWDHPDAVVLVSPALFASALLVPRLVHRRVPFVVWVQDLYGLGLRETASSRYTRLAARVVGRVERFLLRRADAVVVIHERMAAAVMRLGVSVDRVSIVRNWTHIQPRQLRDRGLLRARFGWRSDEAVVLHSGNMGTKQYLANVVAAAREADARQAPVRFVLTGDGVERADIEEAARGVSRLQILPPQPEGDYERMLQAADVLLVNEHPGMHEMALPSKLTSYFASGRPVIAACNSDSTTAAELRAAGAGVRVDPGEPAVLLDGVLALVGEPDRMKAFAESADRYRRSVLTVDRAGRDVQRVLDRLAAPRSRSSDADGYDLVRVAARIGQADHAAADRLAAAVADGARHDPATGPVPSQRSGPGAS